MQSIQGDNMPEFKEDFFTTFEMKCTHCNYWKIHQILSSTSTIDLKHHSTCTCDLLNFGTVCCADGLSSLLEFEPEFVWKIKDTPMLSTVSMLLKKCSNQGHDDDDETYLKCEAIIQQCKSTLNNDIC